MPSKQKINILELKMIC